MKITFIPIILTLVIALLAGVSYAVGPKLPNACAVLNPQEVEKVVGAGFKQSPFAGTASDNSMCGYMKDAHNTVNLVIVPLGMGAQGFTGDTPAALKEMKKTFEDRGIKIVSVEGIGEGAFYPVFPNDSSIHFGKSPWHVTMTVLINGKPDVAAEEKLAKIVYPKL